MSPPPPESAAVRVRPHHWQSFQPSSEVASSENHSVPIPVPAVRGMVIPECYCKYSIGPVKTCKYCDLLYVLVCCVTVRK